MFGKKKKKEFLFDPKLITAAQELEIQATASDRKKKAVNADIQANSASQKKVELAEKRAQLTELESKVARAAAKVAKIKRPSARAKTAKQVKNSSFQFAGKHSNNGKSKPVDKLKAASERFRINNYGSDHKAKAKDREASRKYNLQQAHNHHEATAPSTGAWATISSCEERFGLLSTTIQRVAGDGHILTRSTGKTTLVSIPTLEKFLTDSE